MRQPAGMLLRTNALIWLAGYTSQPRQSDENLEQHRSCTTPPVGPGQRPRAGPSQCGLAQGPVSGEVPSAGVSHEFDTAAQVRRVASKSPSKSR